MHIALLHFPNIYTHAYLKFVYCHLLFGNKKKIVICIYGMYSLCILVIKPMFNINNIVNGCILCVVIEVTKRCVPVGFMYMSQICSTQAEVLAHLNLQSKTV